MKTKEIHGKQGERKKNEKTKETRELQWEQGKDKEKENVRRGIHEEQEKYVKENRKGVTFLNDC